MREKEISHIGRIVSIDSGKVSVEILSESACSACHAAGLCGASESKRKIIEVPRVAGFDMRTGQEVKVCLGRSMGLKAVLVSYVLPVIVLMAFIVVLPLLGFSELATGLVSIAGVCLYYFIVFLLRDRLSGKYEFYIKYVN